MKKIFRYLLIFICIFFVIPAICTKSKSAIEVNQNNQYYENVEQNKAINDQKNETSKYNYTRFGKINLFHNKTGEIEEIPMDEYLYGTVSAEMPVNYEEEAIKAQAIVSRTYTIYQISKNKDKHGKADICDDFNCCQAWISRDERMKRWDENKREENWNKIVNAVNSTAGKVITYNGEVINAFFHSNSGGKTELVSNVWGGRNYPYIQSVETSGENEYDQFNSEVVISKNELIEKIKEKYPDVLIDFNVKDCIKILDYTESGRVKNIKFGNINLAGTEVRKILGLKSTNFNFKIEGENIIFSVIGYGHGVGMSQTGANSMAKEGYLCEEIIKHFYANVQIESW